MLGILCKELHIEFSLTQGKGDHTKLYLNGNLIVLPEHEEWKPGTKKSIQSEITETLKQAVGRK